MNLKDDIAEQKEYLEKNLEQLNIVVSAILGYKTKLDIIQDANYRGEVYYKIIDDRNIKEQCGAMAKAFKKVMSEVRVTDEEAKENFKPLLEKKTVSVAAIVENLAKRLSAYGSVKLYSFFRTAETKRELVTMFLAMLELLKSGILILEETETNSEGVIDAKSDVSVSLEENADISQLTEIIKDE